MTIVNAAIQIMALDEATDPSQNIVAQVGGLGISCPGGDEMQVPTLPAATSALALPFPIGITTAKILFIVALQTSDLLVNVGASNPVALAVPQGMGLVLYNIAQNAITVSSTLGGKIQYVVAG